MCYIVLDIELTAFRTLTVYFVTFVHHHRHAIDVHVDAVEIGGVGL